MGSQNNITLNEPSPESWGGSWTVKKLQTFEAYVKKYLIILNKAKIQYGFKTIYFDGFAGGLKAYSQEFQGGIIQEDIKVYEGSVKRILSMQAPFHFDFYYFIEKEQVNYDKICQFKETITNIPSNSIIVRKDDCNNQLKKLAGALLKDKKYKALIFLDPFGLQIEWSSIELLKGTGSDIWILLPSGVAINRLIPKDYTKFQNEGRKSLEALFGMNKEEIANLFYHKHQSKGIFGLNESTLKVDDSINKIVALYSNKLKNIWTYVSNPLVLKNSKGAPIFHFIFASNNEAGLKIADYIVKEARIK